MLYGNPPKKYLNELNDIIGKFCIDYCKDSEIKKNLNLNSTFKDVADFFDSFSLFELRYAELKKNSPDFKTSLKLWINEIELKIGIDNLKKNRLSDIAQAGKRSNHDFSLLSYSYVDTVRVKCSTLIRVTRYLFSSNADFEFERFDYENIVFEFLPEKLFKISIGYVYAHKLPELKKELKELEKEQIELSMPIENTSAKRLKWLGNTSHLGFIMYQLANKGFIEFPNYNGEINYTGLAERLLNAFEFKDKQPTKKYLSEQINPESENNKISEITKGKLKINITDLQDLG
jgi:hypothetical protein